MTPDLAPFHVVFGNQFTGFRYSEKQVCPKSEILLANGLSGKEIAEKKLRESGIYDVKVTLGEGFISNQNNPVNNTG